ncbi:MAG: retention module-containing protein, partial [Methylophilaceae bacterium]
MAILGTVVSINGSPDAVGKVIVISDDGVKKVLHLSDSINTGDTIITPEGVIVELELANGKPLAIFAEQTVQITNELVDAVPASSGDSAVDQATIQAVITAINEGRDISEVLEETAAGLDGGAVTAYGFSFESLARVIEGVTNPLSYSFTSTQLADSGIQPLFSEQNDFLAAGGATTGGGLVDTTAPIPTISLNAITSDNILNAAEAGAPVAVTGIVGGEFNTGDTVTLTVNGNPYTGTVDAGGNFSINVPGAELAADPDSTVDASVATTDAAGNPGSATGTHIYDVDTAPPAAPTVLLAPPSDSGVPGDNITNDSTPTITGIGTPGDIIRGTIGGTPYGPVTVPSGGTWTFTPVAGLPDGPVAVTVETEDPAGNVTSGAPITITIDTTAPVPTISVDDITADNILNAAEAGAPVAVTGIVGGEFNTGDTVTLTVNGNPYTGTVDAGGNFSINVPGAELAADPDSTVDASVATTDLAGNLGSAAATQVYVVDTGVPIITLNVIAGDDVINALEDDSPVAISGATLNVEDGQTVTVTV